MDVGTAAVAPAKKRPSTLAQEFIADLLEVTGGGRARRFEDVRDHAMIRVLTEGVRRTELIQLQTMDLSTDLIAQPFVRVVPLKGGLNFLAHMAHPLVQPDTDLAARLIAALNTLLAPDDWELRTVGFVSGRPVYAAARTASGPGRMIRLEIGDADDDKLDIVLGQTYLLLGENGDALAQELIVDASLTLRRDGGYFQPIPGDNWTEATYGAVLTVDPRLAAEFTTEAKNRIWTALGAVLTHHGRQNVQSLEIQQTVPPLRAIGADWRAQAAQPEGSHPATRRGASAPRTGIRPRTASYSAAVPSLPSIRPLLTSSANSPSRTQSPCCRCPEPSSATRACVPRTSSWSAMAAPRSSRSTGATTTARPARPTTPTATCTGGGAALTPSASPASTPVTPRP